MDPSGIRIGTPALTTRGMATAEMQTIGQWILDVLKAPEDSSLSDRVRVEIQELCRQFPVPAVRLASDDVAIGGPAKV